MAMTGGSTKKCIVFAMFMVASIDLVSGHAYIYFPPLRGGTKGSDVNGYCPQCMGSVDLPMPVCGKDIFQGYQNGPVTPLKAGEKLLVQVVVTAHHKGHFQLRLCDKEIGSSQSKLAIENCLNQHILKRVKPEEMHSDCKANDLRGDCQPYDDVNPGYWYVPPASLGDIKAGVQTAGINFKDSQANTVAPNHNTLDQHPSLLEIGDKAFGNYTLDTDTRAGASYSWHVWIPKNIQCNKCTIQWAWKSANSCTPHEDAYRCYFQKMENLGWDAKSWCSGPCSFKGTCPATQGSPKGCGEEFANCADVKIEGGGGSPPTQAPSPPIAPTTQSPATTPTPTQSPPTPTQSPPTLAPCDDGGPSSCKYMCQMACDYKVQTNQCWGTPGRFVQCVCSDGKTHSFAGCPCTHTSCPEVTPGPATTSPPGPGPTTTKGASPTTNPPTFPPSTTTSTTVSPTPSKSTSPPEPEPEPSPSTTKGVGGCTGAPCEQETECRSKWGSCGTSDAHCNAESTWSAGCGGRTGGCTGAPCEHPTECRSQWGHCGTSTAYCNLLSTWKAGCGGGTANPPTQPTQPPSTTQSGPVTGNPPTQPPSGPGTGNPPTQPPSTTPSGPVTGCTGDAEVDAILAKANMPVAAKLVSSARGANWDPSVYSWDGFCDAYKTMSQVGMPMYAGTAGSPSRVAEVLVNIASLVAQSMWESGGDAPWSACDENNYMGWPTAACTQRSDGARYDSLTTPQPACAVDLNMRMTAVTQASWAKNNPLMQCEPGTSTAGCCWWGRGAIQTTGPRNYKLLQDDVIAKRSSLQNIDLCQNPEAICQHKQLMWIGAFHYWAKVVQNAHQFQPSLTKYVESDFNDAATTPSFNAGTGGKVNNGHWAAQAHSNTKRMKYFHEIISALKAAGMQKSSLLECTARITSAVATDQWCSSCSEASWCRVTQTMKHHCADECINGPAITKNY